MKIRIVSTPKLGFKDWGLNVQGSSGFTALRLRGLQFRGPETPSLHTPSFQEDTLKQSRGSML